VVALITVEGNINKGSGRETGWDWGIQCHFTWPTWPLIWLFNKPTAAASSHHLLAFAVTFLGQKMSDSTGAS